MSTLPPEGQQPEVPVTPPAAAPQQPAAADSALNSLTLNYWLSVFFSWLPALIFWLIEKDKGNARATQLHVFNFNFSLLRLGVSLLTFIPVIGWVLGGIGGIVLFVFHIMAAVKVADAYKKGTPVDPFTFNVPIIK